MFIFAALIGVLATLAFTSDKAPRIKDHLRKSVYIVETPEGGHGTGWVASTEDGLVVITNRHVCGLDPDAKLRLKDEEGFDLEVKIIKISKTTDLCALEAPADAKPLEIGDEVGRDEKVYTAGYGAIRFLTLKQGVALGVDHEAYTMEPIGQDLTPEKCLEYGRPQILFMMTKKGPVVQFMCRFDIPNSIQTDIIAHAGASGSPIVNTSGEVVGVLWGGQGVPYPSVLAMMVPASDLKTFIESL